MSSVRPHYKSFANSAPSVVRMANGAKTPPPDSVKPKNISNMPTLAASLVGFAALAFLWHKMAQLPQKRDLETFKKEILAKTGNDSSKTSKLQKALPWLGAVTGPICIIVGATARNRGAVDTVARHNATDAQTKISELDEIVNVLKAGTVP